MYPGVDESQNRKQHGPQWRRLAALRPLPKGREEGQESRATKNEEEDLRIMQHFVRDLIERSQDRDPL